MKALGAAVAASLALSSAAFAQGEGFRMLYDANNPFPYYIDGRSMSPTSNLLLSDIQSATDTAWQTWQAVPCNNDAFVDLGSSASNPNITDPENVYGQYNLSTVWITDGGDPYYDYALVGQVVGMAIPQAYGGILYNCDIFMNGVDFAWSVNGQPPPILGTVGWADVQTIVLHESGHCQGLGHTDGVNDVMFSYEALDTTKRVLSATDVQNICATAPKVGAVGSPCSATADCQSGTLSCIHQPLPDGGVDVGMCSEGCDPQSAVVQCPSPFVCEQSSLIAGSTGACFSPLANYVTQVGAACTGSGQCGGAAGICATESFPSGDPAWLQGYCTQLCGSQFEACPGNSTCIVDPVSGANDICTVNCRLGGADCRPGYACAALSTGTGAVCVPGCEMDVDCAAGYVCRSCDGACIATGGAGIIGDTCTGPSNCGTGQLCLGFGTNPAYGVCSSTCGTSCTNCPTGSSCLPVGAGGTLYCLVNCAAGGACPPGLYCGQTTSGAYACVPATCGTTNDCPVGDVCVGGVCENPSDAGPPPPYDAGPPPPYDAGHPGGGGGGGDGGCGCRGADAFPVVLIGLAFLAAHRRRRAWASR